MGRTWCRGAGAGPLSSGHFNSATADRCRMNSIALAAPAAKSSTSFSAASTVQAACARIFGGLQHLLMSQTLPTILRVTIRYKFCRAWSCDYHMSAEFPPYWASAVSRPDPKDIGAARQGLVSAHQAEESGATLLRVLLSAMLSVRSGRRMSVLCIVFLTSMPPKSQWQN